MLGSAHGSDSGGSRGQERLSRAESRRGKMRAGKVFGAEGTAGTKAQRHKSNSSVQWWSLCHGAWLEACLWGEGGEHLWRGWFGVHYVGRGGVLMPTLSCSDSEGNLRGHQGGKAGVRLSGFIPQLCSSLRYSLSMLLNTSCLSFLICEIGIVIVLL